ncbi:Alcohol dehydrogenase zinc-binding domain protein (plasmid) [Rhizobium leguminosarum bv. trifolii WSM2304]|uniref:Alcohol dehydrogenase zinc-binding domain protein n=1 Tax=Rhizobium leguminosarum bv. trifolii (strain WSM2304) TaxID=395492 RepID=A0ABF7QZE1_RHILW|nr:NADP-dependent oxidoreductase [Rhizobium leguminosarum]ACI59559.1 Alcohol dehydrogenase zinc-binding domain protein [Rhizobium leguminosarum bv. trifolii WSM2304]
MTNNVNRKVVLAARPDGNPKPSDFRLETEAVPVPGKDQLLLRTRYLSLDPYYRSLMGNANGTSNPLDIGATMIGSTVSEVVESDNPAFVKGDIVCGFAGWQDYSLSDGSELQKLDPESAPVSTALGVLGFTGMTAYVGLTTIGVPKPGETVVVSAATGAVGSIAVQIAKLKGARVVGIAGGKEKTDYLVNELGADAAVDHRAPDFADQLKKAVPNGIDVDFESVGGKVFEAVFPLLNHHARVIVCGVVSQYNSNEPASGPNLLPSLLEVALWKRMQIRGFGVDEHSDQFENFQRDVGGWVKEGEIKYREDVVQGLENAAEAFPRLFTGGNFGRLIVKF